MLNWKWQMIILRIIDFSIFLVVTENFFCEYSYADLTVWYIWLYHCIVKYCVFFLHHFCPFHSILSQGFLLSLSFVIWIAYLWFSHSISENLGKQGSFNYSKGYICMYVLLTETNFFKDSWRNEVHNSFPLLSTSWMLKMSLVSPWMQLLASFHKPMAPWYEWK